jgi:hypothetical protein
MLDEGAQCDMIFLDFAKAFDKVTHLLLLHKLQVYGISGQLLDWFIDYLTNRQQHVVVNGVSSENIVITSGVPQGSILGPFLFLLYINDMPSLIQDPTEIMLFADDAKIFSRIRNVNDQYLLEDQLDKLFKWSCKWQMKFNINKCVVMSISTKKDILQYQYKMNGINLNIVKDFKDLGVNVNSRLNWTDHIMCIKGKALRNLGYIKRVLGLNAPLNVKLVLYNSLVKSVISYCTPVWSPHKKGDIIQLEHIQRQATRYFVKYANMSYIDRLRSLRMLPLTYDREIIDLLTFYNLYHGRYNIGVDMLFHVTELRRGRILNRLAGELSRIKCKTDLGRSLYCVRVLKIWDNLPVNLQTILPPVNANSKCTGFKNALKKHYASLLTTKFNTDNLCTWVSVCTCHVCRN